jgi:hypothetical protein
MEAKFITLPKPGKDPKFPQNLHLISLMSTAGKLFEKVILNIVQRHIEDRGLLIAKQFGFHARHIPARELHVAFKIPYVYD